MKRLITSESVSNGHPDKVADQISDAILDEYLKLDKESKVAVETMVKDNCVVLGGEVKSKVRFLNYESIVKDVIKNIGYNDPNHGFYYKNITVINLIGQQSKEINKAVGNDEDLGAGDQGFMVGFATNETETHMPIGMYVSKKLVDYVSSIDGLGPDVKAQTTMEINSDKRIHTILVSTMHLENIHLKSIKDKIIGDILGNRMGLSDNIFNMIDSNTKIIVNPAGSWNIGGPVSDCGLTGRKIVVDQYGPYCAVGGGAFSGKDPSKVDRSAAYLARYIAKNIVSAGLANQCKVELAYMIGVSEPSSINVDTFGDFDDDQLIDLVKKAFPMTPNEIITHFNLKDSIYLESSRGHFGNDNMPWEKIDTKFQEMASALKVKV